MKYFEVGQKVYYLADDVLKNGIVTSIDNDSPYTILVDFSDGSNATFTNEGKLYEGCGIRLFQTKPIITPNVPIFEERPAYFYRDGYNDWIFDIIVGIDANGSGKSKRGGYWYTEWQYEAPTL